MLLELQRIQVPIGQTLILNDVTWPEFERLLNLIERLWKFVRKECLYSKYYADFDSFKTAISSLIETAHIDKYKELKSLMRWKFQSFKKVKFLGV